MINKEIVAVVYGTRRKSRRIALFSLVLATFASSVLAQTAKTELRIGVVTSRGAPTLVEVSSLRGIRLGAAEARQTAQLFGDKVDIYEASGEGRTLGAQQAAAFLLSGRKVQILIGIVPTDADVLAKFSEEHGAVFLNVASRSDALRSACRSNSFHIE